MFGAAASGYQYLDTNLVWPECLGIEIRCQLIQSVLIVKVSRVNNVNVFSFCLLVILDFFKVKKHGI